MVQIVDQTVSCGPHFSHDTSASSSTLKLECRDVRKWLSARGLDVRPDPELLAVVDDQLTEKGLNAYLCVPFEGLAHMD